MGAASTTSTRRLSRQTGQAWSERAAGSPQHGQGSPWALDIASDIASDIAKDCISLLGSGHRLQPLQHARRDLAGAVDLVGAVRALDGDDELQVARHHVELLDAAAHPEGSLPPSPRTSCTLPAALELRVERLDSRRSRAAEALRCGRMSRLRMGGWPSEPLL